MIHSIFRTRLWESHGEHYPIIHKSRKTSGLMLILGGGEYLYINGKCQHLVQGDIYFLRRGEHYRLELDNGYVKCYVINFQCDDEMLSFVLNNCNDLANQFAKIVSLWNNKQEGTYDELDCMGLLYHLLAECFRRRYVNSIPRRKKERVAPAIGYMQLNYADQELKINDLAELCGLGDRSFRRLFHEVYGLSPKRYLSALRVKYAKEFLADNHSVSEVAQLCGFHDVYHFSNFFRSECGMSPSEYIHSISDDRLL